MSIQHLVASKLQAAWPVEDWQEVTVLVAVSGGCDSVALLRALALAKQHGSGRLVVAHYNHRWRAAAADADEQFVTNLAEQLSLTVEIGRARHRRHDAGAGQKASEELARHERYAFLEKAAGRCGARYVATAHTADDQAETVLQRIVRGTGLNGLAGIRRVRHLGHATLIRPFLSMRRAELATYLHSLNQAFCDDATNHSLDYTRSRIRHELLPLLSAHYNRHVGEALIRLSALAGEAQAILDSLARQMIEQSVTHDDDGALRVNVTPLWGQPRYLVREVFVHCWRTAGWPEQDMTFAHWDLLAEMLLGAAEMAPGAAARHAARQTLPGNILAECDADGLRLMPQPMATAHA